MTRTPQRSSVTVAPTPQPASPVNLASPVSLADSSRTWAKIGMLSFGGPAAQIALMHREIVTHKGWLSDQQFANALSFCMLLPGPEAMQLATYSGWRLHGMRGGLVAGGLFVLPGALVMLGLAMGYVYFGALAWVGALFMGLQAGIIIIVLQALLKLTKRALRVTADWVIGVAGFVSIFALNVPFPIIIGSAALYGFLTSKTTNDHKSVIPFPDWRPSLTTAVQWGLLWWAPLLFVAFIIGNQQLTAIGFFFSKLAVVTFGGAYAVLAYMAQDVVGQLGWLSASTMMDGLGLAETTPGPLILVTEFVGFVAAFKSGGLAYGIAGAVIALWATFAPCFLWIFVGARYIDWLTHQPRLQGALSSIMAAVVGVIANLFVWFIINSVFDDLALFSLGPVQVLIPTLTAINYTMIAIAGICGAVAVHFKASLFSILALAAGLGTASALITTA